MNRSMFLCVCVCVCVFVEGGSGFGSVLGHRALTPSLQPPISNHVAPCDAPVFTPEGGVVRVTGWTEHLLVMLPGECDTCIRL